MSMAASGSIGDRIIFQTVVKASHWPSSYSVLQ